MTLDILPCLNVMQIRDGNKMAKFGIKYPLTIKDGKLMKVTAQEKVEQAIKIILTTYPGERWGLSEYGSKLLDFLLQPDSIFLRSRIRSEIETALRKWIPGIQIEDIQIRNAFDREGNLIIYIKYGIGLSQGLQKNEMELNILTANPKVD